MQKLYSHVIGSKVVRKYDGELLGIVVDAIVKPENLKIEALYVKTKDFPARYLVLLERDIAEWKLKIYVEDEHSLVLPREVVRLHKILRQKIPILGNKVITIDEIYIGKVVDYSFDTDLSQVINLYVIKKFLFFNIDKRVISRNEIVKVKKEAILVKSDLKTVKWRKRQISEIQNFVFTPDTNF